MEETRKYFKIKKSKGAGYETFVEFRRNWRECKKNFGEEGEWNEVIKRGVKNEAIGMWEIRRTVEEIEIRFT